MINEKQRIADISVIAGIFLTSSELIVGIFTGSLGLLAVALYSGVNLVTAIITFFQFGFPIILLIRNTNSDLS